MNLIIVNNSIKLLDISFKQIHSELFTLLKVESYVQHFYTYQISSFGKMSSNKTPF